ncbi:MAG: ligase-associated DNA damage response exonuclease [Geminicoccaceae bacterium]|nr:ligase-associated DNA damage response exonuclease [Geminicoccaceae bacterium]
MSRFAWLEPRPEGLFVRPGGFFLDPLRAVARAVISHGHGDHARPGHGEAIATPETCAILEARYGREAFGRLRPLPLETPIELGEVSLWFAPAGHVLGSAQIVLEHRGTRVVWSGDYKRRPDPTCAPFRLVPCDLWITEATFGLPVFRHPPAEGEIAELLRAREANPERAIVVGAYGLGKAQRLIALLRRAGYDRPIFLHGALLPLCALYERLGVRLGPLSPATTTERGRIRRELAGEIVLAPPSALADRWIRRLPDPLLAFASGWMRIKQRAKRRGVELPLVISDHADWDELLATCGEVGAEEIWITHGREEALIHVLSRRGIRARPLALSGYEEETD